MHILSHKIRIIYRPVDTVVERTTNSVLKDGLGWFPSAIKLVNQEELELLRLKVL